MIGLRRARTDAAIALSLRGEDRIDKLIELLHGYRVKKHAFKSGYWKAAKKQIKAESFGKCAYCEAPVDAVAHGDVEHFRPKGKYWWLAYCYDNYVFACQICNQSFKGEEFPCHGPMLELVPPLPDPFLDGLALQLDPPLPDPFPEVSPEQLRPLVKQFAPDPLNDADGYPMAQFSAAVAREKAGLPDPYVIDPEPLFKWVADATRKEVAIAPRNQTVAVKRAFKAVDAHLGLNRPELLKIRWRTFKTLSTLRNALASGLLPPDLAAETKAEIVSMTADDAPFAGMVRYFVRDVWQLDLE
jgi:hypothetical protein